MLVEGEIIQMYKKYKLNYSVYHLGFFVLIWIKWIQMSKLIDKNGKFNQNPFL